MEDAFEYPVATKLSRARACANATVFIDVAAKLEPMRTSQKFTFAMVGQVPHSLFTSQGPEHSSYGLLP